MAIIFTFLTQMRVHYVPTLPNVSEINYQSCVLTKEPAYNYEMRRRWGKTRKRESGGKICVKAEREIRKVRDKKR